jgi:hypothetical protein
VAVHLRDGAVLRGKAMSVTPGGLQMAVSNAPKGAAKYGKGEFLIPAGEVAMLKVNRNGKRGRIIGSVIGGGLGALAGVIPGTGYVTSEFHRDEVESTYELSFEVT